MLQRYNIKKYLSVYNRFFSSLQNKRLKNDNFCNITDNIKSKIGRNLHLQENHPLGILKNIISNQSMFNDFKIVDNLSPIVNPKQCFDDLLIPKDHISRSLSDTYYFNNNKLLRTHTSAHQIELMKKKL